MLPFFDYDIEDLPNIVLELMSIQKEFNLSNIYLLKSSNGYNAFSLDKLFFNVINDIFESTEFVDNDFIKWGLNRGFLTLRMGEDKKIISVLVSKSKNINYKKSLPHKKFFNEIMEFDIKDDINFDNESKIIITMFPSNKHGVKKGVYNW